MQEELTELNERLEETVQELEKARIEAENERRRLEAVMEALPVGVAIVNTRGSRVRSNAAFERVWGGRLPAAHSKEDYSAYKAWRSGTGKLFPPKNGLQPSL